MAKSTATRANPAAGKKKVSKKKAAKKKTTKKQAVKKTAAKKATPAKKPVASKPARTKKSGAARQNSKPSISPRERDEMIAVAAYFRWEQSGYVAELEMEHWLQAEQDIDDLLNQSS